MCFVCACVLDAYTAGRFLFHDLGLSDQCVGVVLLVASMSLLCACLLLIVKLLNSSLHGRVLSAARTAVNAELPGRARCLAGYVAMLAGAALTVLVQSSSVFTSTLTPLVGVGVISIERVYPLCLGSNIGTTTTGILAAFASPAVCLHAALQIALCHLLFNITGIFLFYPFPASRLPVRLAKSLGATTARYRWFAVLYLTVMFFVLPLIVLGLSAAGHGVLTVAVAVVGVVAVSAATLTAFQRHRPERAILTQRDVLRWTGPVNTNARWTGRNGQFCGTGLSVCRLRYDLGTGCQSGCGP